MWAEVHKECASLVREMGEKVARIYCLEISDDPEKKVVLDEEITRLGLPPGHVKYLGDYADSSLSSLDACTIPGGTGGPRPMA